MRIYWDTGKNTAQLPALRAAVRNISRQLGWFVTSEPGEGDLVLKIDSSAGHIHVPLSGDEFVIPAGNIFTENYSRKRLNCLNKEDDVSFDISQPDIDHSNQLLHKNLVNALVSRGFVFLRMLPWPGGKPFALAMTHDVDLARQYGIKMLLKMLSSGKLNKFARGFAAYFSGKNSYWTFPELTSLYETLDWKATFFFITRSWEDFNYRYNFRSKKFWQLYRDLLADGHEIGLHSSKYAFDFPERYVTEKMQLERVIQKQLAGIRQHYLRLQFPEAWKYFEMAGFSYDTSCGFNGKIGFRAGTSFPFQPVNLEENQAFELFEVPFQVMDYPWVESSASADANWEAFTNIVDQVRKVGGILNVLWHPSNIAEPAFRPWWDKMIGYLRKQEFYQETLRGILQWWQTRDEVILESIITHKNEIEIVLITRDAVPDLTLEIATRHQIKSVTGNASLSGNPGDSYSLHIPQLSFGKNVFKLLLG